MPFSHRTLRGRRYWDLREKHFTARESAEFSKLNRKYPAVVQAIASRSALWSRFGSHVKKQGWESDYKIKREWEKVVVGFYKRIRSTLKRDKKTGRLRRVDKDWIVARDIHGKKVPPRINPWDWYDSIFRNLPDELRWDTPRSHRTRQPVVVIDKIRNKRWISDLEKAITRTKDEKQRARFRMQIVRLQKSIRDK